MLNNLVVKVYELFYRSHMELKVSDHKPVSAIFRSGLNIICHTDLTRPNDATLPVISSRAPRELPPIGWRSLIIIVKSSGRICRGSKGLKIFFKIA